VTLPVSFGKHKADLLRKAAVAAGFDAGQITLVGEPMAAATYYLLKQDKSERVKEGDLVLVYDLGGGTFDTALVRRKGNGFEQVGEPTGIEHCGGRDFDRAIAQDFLKCCSLEARDLLTATSEQGRRARRELQEFCVKVKHDLSETEVVEHDLLLPGLEPEIYNLSQIRFNEMIAPFVTEAVATAEELARQCTVKMNEVSLVLMVGGSCRIPYVGAEIERRLRRPVAMVDEPELAVALGAAVLAEKCISIQHVTRNWENSLGMRFVSVAGTKVFFSIWETRVKDYQAFVDSAKKPWKNPSFEQGPNHPSVNVSWDDAKEFCEWLTTKERNEGKIRTTQEYRLPIDEEWSIAVGLPSEDGDTPQEKGTRFKRVYPWGTQWPPPKKAGNFNSHGTTPVGSFAANEKGLYDMGGNVSEWCEDLYSVDTKYRVLRGASWLNGTPDSMASAYRLGLTPSFRDVIGGFRCVLGERSSR